MGLWTYLKSLFFNESEQYLEDSWVLLSDEFLPSYYSVSINEAIDKYETPFIVNCPPTQNVLMFYFCKSFEIHGTENNFVIDFDNFQAIYHPKDNTLETDNINLLKYFSTSPLMILKDN